MDEEMPSLKKAQFLGRIDVTVAVPAFNEAENLSKTLESIGKAVAKVPGIHVEILVINDGSTDGTAAVADTAADNDSSIRILHHNTNQGLGASIKEAIKEARGEKFLIVPGDNDMPVSILTLLMMHSDKADMIMCYFLDRETRGRWRNALSTLFALFYASIFDIYVSYLNGPSIYPTKRLQGLTLRAWRFSIVAEINTKLMRQGASFLELPGYRQTGLRGSSSLRWRNLVETMWIFISTVCDVYLYHRAEFCNRPRRVLLKTDGI